MADGPSSVASVVLREALRHLEEDLPKSPDFPLDATQLSQGLAYLARLGEAAPFDLPPGDSPVPPKTLRDLWNRLRFEAMLCVTRLEDPPAAEVIDLWTTLERIGVLVAEEEASAGDFLARLQGPDLVLELAHDLRSPLTSVLFLCDVLRAGQSGPVNDLQQRQLRIIYSAALGLVSMASDVIEMAQGGERLLEREPSSFSIRGILDALVDLVQPIAEERGLSLRVISPAEDRRVGHPVALSRVLLNLTTNALKFTEAGFVEISAQSSGSRSVAFSVRDTGGGLASDALVDLFNPLRRKASGREYGLSGSGLGLMICRRLVRAQGSELKLETIRGWGTRFYFDLDLPPAPSQ